MIYSGIVLLLLWGGHRALYMRSMRLSDTLLQTFAPKPSEQTLYPTHITIGTLIDLPIIEAGHVDGQWLISDTRANHVAKSAVPGVTGNIIIYAHNRRELFGPLLQLKGGETITLRTADGTTHTYRVVRTQEVDPTYTQLLAPTNTEVLTLYTCSGFFDSKRFVVRAVPEKQ